MSRFAIGGVVSYIPKREIFAISSGSHTGTAAQKYRPCLVVSMDKQRPVIIPLCGAVLVNGQWERREKMISEWWLPVNYVGTSINIPFDGFELRSRKALDIPYNSSVGMPPEHPRFKPSYVWCGDQGEPLEPDAQALARPLSQYIHLPEAQRKLLKEWWEILKAMGRAPPP